jgi:hypothetical protein
MAPAAHDNNAQNDEEENSSNDTDDENVVHDVLSPVRFTIFSDQAL